MRFCRWKRHFLFYVFLTCLRSCWTIQRSACSSQICRYRHIICWLRRIRCAIIYSQWSVHNLKIRRERFFMVFVKYWSIDLKRKQCCSENIWALFNFQLLTHSEISQNSKHNQLNCTSTKSNDRYNNFSISSVTVSNFFRSQIFFEFRFLFVVFLFCFSYHFYCGASYTQ